VIILADAAPGNEEVIAALCAEKNEFYGSSPQGTPSERAAQVRDALFANPPLGHALLVWDGNALAGFATYSFLWPAAGLTASLYLKELYVTMSYRRSGAGKLLMDGIYRIAANRGCSRVEWTTDVDNPGAQAFYEALGAKPLASKIFYRVTGHDRVGIHARLDLPGILA
jgi:ribosomal protein S18 acetylase RimI-like enzyme